MPTVSRRQLLELFAAAVPTAALACRSDAPFLDERVCVHVFPPSLALPAPLLEELGAPPQRQEGTAVFDTGLPELLVCATSVPFLQLFPYFWPLSQAEFDRCRRSIRILFSSQRLPGDSDENELGRWLSTSRPGDGPHLAGILTYNRFTRFHARRHLSAFRSAALPEIVVFKDPTVAPYLCDFPAAQKGFRRPP